MLSTTFDLGTNFLSHVTCPEASYHATNLAYIVDDAVTDCLELFHDIAPFARVKIYVDVDFLSSASPAKSDSEYPSISKDSDFYMSA